MKQGTEWTEPGQGATAEKLWDAIEKADFPACHANLCGCQHARSNLSRLVTDSKTASGRRRRNGPQNWRFCRTNLRLTGAPLQASDIENIARAK